MSERKGNPTVGMVLLPEERDLVDAYKTARGLSTRSQALRELVLWALGDNPYDISAIGEKLPSTSPLHEMKREVLEA